MAATPISLDVEARTRILDDHAALRALLDGALTLASAAGAGDLTSRQELPTQLARVFARVAGNFAFEEAALFARLREALACGWLLDLARLRRLLAEHARFKDRFAALDRRREQLAPAAYAGAVKRLLTLLTRHLAEEEGWLLDLLPAPVPGRAAS